jgi:D-glycero-D-manno-heptose 1,7-bisphosphate phosphatase
MTRPSAVFLDRDGVIIENQSEYVKSWQEVHFLPGALRVLRRLNETGHRIVMVTNQSAVGRGIISMSQAMEINQSVIEKIESHGGRIDTSYMCPHHPDEGCGCRKPAPGMLRRAAEDLGLDLSRSYLVGDAVSDILAARAVSVHGVLVLTGRGQEQASLLEVHDLSDCPVVPDLEAAVDYILKQEEGSGWGSSSEKATGRRE